MAQPHCVSVQDNRNKTMIDGLAHLLFPRVCIVCRKLLDPEESHICQACFIRFSPYPDPLAGGLALVRTISEHFGERVHLSSAWALYPYHSKGPLHDALHAMKYGGLFPLGTLFGKRLGELVRSQNGQDSFDMIVPVPLHPLKRIERSYNQAEAIADGIAGVIGRPVARRVVERCVATSSQTGLSLKERQRNMQGAFRPGAVASPGRVLLVDDVLTTGATMVAAASALKDAGASEVVFAVVALTEKD